MTGVGWRLPRLVMARTDPAIIQVSGLTEALGMPSNMFMATKRHNVAEANEIEAIAPLCQSNFTLPPHNSPNMAR